MAYQIFRLSLMARRKPPVLEYIEGDIERQPRNIFLIETFGKRIDFVHRQNAFIYVPVEFRDELTMVVGRLGRPQTETAADTPENKFAPLKISVNHAANFYLNTSSDPDGQKIAMQAHSRVGAPGALLKSLVQHLNDFNPDGPWIMDVHPLIDEQSFWDAVDAHEKEITKITFKLVAPNIFGFTDNVSTEMKAARDENNANNVTLTMENKEGIRLRTPSVINAVKYVAAGGGYVILSGKFKKFFNSEKKQVSVDVENDVPAEIGHPAILERIKNRLFGP